MSRSGFLCALALLPTAAVAQPASMAAPPPPAARATARSVVEMQLDTRAVTGSGLTGAEAKRVRDRYLDSIGRTIETDRIAAGSTPK